MVYFQFAIRWRFTPRRLAMTALLDVRPVEVNLLENSTDASRFFDVVEGALADYGDILSRGEAIEFAFPDYPLYRKPHLLARVVMMCAKNGASFEVSDQRIRLRPITQE